MNGSCKNVVWWAGSASNYKTRVSCESVGGAWTPQNGPANWTDCVMDRDKNYDASNTLPNVAVARTLVWPVNDSACPTEIL